LFEDSRPALIVLKCVLAIVNGSVDFDDQPQFWAVEIANETPDDMLPAEFVTEAIVVPENRPRAAFGLRGSPAQLPGPNRLGPYGGTIAGRNPTTGT